MNAFWGSKSGVTLDWAYHVQYVIAVFGSSFPDGTLKLAPVHPAMLKNHAWATPNRLPWCRKPLFGLPMYSWSKPNCRAKRLGVYGSNTGTRLGTYTRYPGRMFNNHWNTSRDKDMLIPALDETSW